MARARVFAKASLLLAGPYLTAKSRRCTAPKDVVIALTYILSCGIFDGQDMISAAQLRAARALLGIDQRRLADLAGLSVPTIQRMEASGGIIRGNVDSLTKLIAAFDAAGIELIGEGALSQGGGRGVRMK
jgi:DNA-binding XRE family transcriptional regulator